MSILRRVALLALFTFFVVLGGTVLSRFIRTTAPHVYRRAVRLETHFAPEENLERIDVQTLREAHSSVEMFGYSLTDFPVIAALREDALRGAIVCVYLDREQTVDELQRPALRQALLDLAHTPNVYVLVKRSAILQHTKGYVIDTNLLREGSANFSPSALKQQDNDLLLTDDAGAVTAFERSYQVAWRRPDNIPLVNLAQ